MLEYKFIAQKIFHHLLTEDTLIKLTETLDNETKHGTDYIIFT